MPRQCYHCQTVLPLQCNDDTLHRNYKGPDMQHPSVHVAQHKHAHHTIDAHTRVLYILCIRSPLGMKYCINWAGGLWLRARPARCSLPPSHRCCTLSDKVLFTLYCTHTRARHDQLQHTVFDMTYGHCLAGPCLENLEDSHPSMR